MIDAKTLMEMQIEEAVSPYRSYAAKLEKMVSELQKQNYLIEEENHQLRKENSQLRASLQRLNRQVNQLQQKLSEVEEEWEMDKKRLYELEKKNKEYKEKMLSSLGDQLYLLTTSYLDILKEVALQTQTDILSVSEIERVYEAGKEIAKSVIDEVSKSPYAIQLYRIFAKTLFQNLKMYQIALSLMNDNSESNTAKLLSSYHPYIDKLSELEKNLSEYIRNAPEYYESDKVALLIHHYEMNLARLSQIPLTNEESLNVLIETTFETQQNVLPKK